MSDDIRIHRLPPYPGRNQGEPERRSDDGKPEGDAEKSPVPTETPPEPEVKDGHIDTRVAPQSRERTFV